MGLIIDELVEAHNSIDSINSFNHSRKQAERTGRNLSRPRHREYRQLSRSRSGRSSAFCTHCHDVSEFWSMRKKENSRRFERNTGRSNSNHSPEGNQINVADSRSGEILSLENSTIREVHYNVQVLPVPWGNTFDMTTRYRYQGSVV